MPHVVGKSYESVDLRAGSASLFQRGCYFMCTRPERSRKVTPVVLSLPSRRLYVEWTSKALLNSAKNSELESAFAGTYCGDQIVWWLCLPFEKQAAPVRRSDYSIDGGQTG